MVELLSENDSVMLTDNREGKTTQFIFCFHSSPEGLSSNRIPRENRVGNVNAKGVNPLKKQEN